MNDRAKLVTIFGGSGFLGRHVVRALARRGYRVRVACRRPDLAFHLQPLGGVGQVMAVQANLRNRASVDRAVAGADHVVNLVGIPYETGRQRFPAIQGFGARAVAEAARAAGATLVHVSAIGADADSPSSYARSKAEGERAVRETVPGAIILRPSILFGPGDGFFEKFAGLSTITPVLPLIGGGHTRFQPAYVGDVAEAVARAVEGRATAGATYELGGPEVMSFRQCMETMLAVIHRRKLLVPVPFFLARWKAAFLGLLPKPLVTVDQVRLLERDNVVSGEAMAAGHTLAGLGIEPTAAAAILPTYLWRFRKEGQFEMPGSMA